MMINHKIENGLSLGLILAICFSLLVVSPVAGQEFARQTIIIQPDGTIWPSNVPIQRNGDTYTLTADTYDPILIQKSGIIFDGAGYNLIGPLNATQRRAQQIIGLGPNNTTQVPYIIGIDVDDEVSQVIIKNLNVHNFSIGAYLRSTNNSLIGNNVTDNIVGVLLSGSANHVTYNLISGNEQGLFFGFETVDGVGNIPNSILISHNSFVGNTRQLSGCVCKEYNLTEERHSWDDGKEGNYWSDYTGTDAEGDGIGDTPYIVDILNQDSYPLMQRPVLPSTTESTLQIEIIVLLIAVPIVAVILIAFIVWKRRSKPQ
jgi:hypothetical protein